MTDTLLAYQNAGLAPPDAGPCHACGGDQPGLRRYRWREHAMILHPACQDDHRRLVLAGCSFAEIPYLPAAQRIEILGHRGRP